MEMEIIDQEYKIVDIDTVYPHEKNVNDGDIGAIHESIDEHKFYGAIIVNRATNKIISGKHRWLTAKQKKAKKIPVIFVDEVEDDQAVKMMIGENRINRLGVDKAESLLGLLNEIRVKSPTGLKGTGFNEDDMDLLMSDLQVSYNDATNILNPKNKKIEKELDLQKIINPKKEEPKTDRATLRVQEEDEDQESYTQVLNQIQSLIQGDNFKESNEWGILDLDPNNQLEEINSDFLQLWGTKKILGNKGIYHFFTDDYRYTSLFQNPDEIIKLTPYGIIEPNFGISNLFPKAVALYRIYQKRWIARNCQKYGIKVAVNLDMPVEFMSLNFLGVPKNWNSFAANGNILNTDQLYIYKELAVNHTENEDINYFIYGGGKRVGELCKENGWMWINEINELNKKLKK